MIKVIEHGKTTFVATCIHCGCKFEYALSDLNSGYSEWVGCPDCNWEYIHPNQGGNNKSSISYIPGITDILPTDTPSTTVSDSTPVINTPDLNINI